MQITAEMIRAAAESRAKDDEGEFEPLMDLLGFSGQNASHTVIRAALAAALEVAPKVTGTPTEKPVDDFSALMGAIARLQHVIKSMGRQAEVAEIRLKPTRHGRDEVERAIRASPSYLQQAWFPFQTSHPPGFVCEVMGVKITIET